MYKNRPEEQITVGGYFKDVQYWDNYAQQIGGIEVCDDATGEVLFVIG